MRIRLPRRLILAGALALSASAWAGYFADRDLGHLQAGDVLLFDQPARGSSSQGSQKIRLTTTNYELEYGFPNFNGDRLAVSLSLSRRALEDYKSQFGYSQKDLDDLTDWHNSARQAAYRRVVAQGRGQAELDRSLKDLEKEYQGKREHYLRSKGFKVVRKNLLTVDMPLIVRRNTPLVRTLAVSIEAYGAKRGYRSEEYVGAVASMAQTAIQYRLPPDRDGPRKTGGLLAPLEVLAKGWGDCDSKTGLVASILKNWQNMQAVGVSVPRHYLMGVLRIPAKGDTFVEYQGLQYVLIEPAGPAWLPPGTVGRETLTLLQASEGYEIEPFS